MSTSEYRSVDAEGDLPISEAELAALASQLFASRTARARTARRRRRQWPRAATCPTRRRRRRRPPPLRRAADPVAPPAQFVAVPNVTIPAPTSPGPEAHSAASGSGRPARQRAGHHRGPVGGTCRRRCGGPVPAPGVSGLDCVRGALGHRADDSRGAGRRTSAQRPGAPRGSAPTWPGTAPAVTDLGRQPARRRPARRVTKPNYYFLTGPARRPRAGSADPGRP